MVNETDSTIDGSVATGNVASDVAHYGTVNLEYSPALY